uniref:Uncharacterized protein n=1 Tax=Anguilla anguilla TaxID=7936 RepID=A0A0E9Q7D6_ANGAN
MEVQLETIHSVNFCKCVVI